MLRAVGVFVNRPADPSHWVSTDNWLKMPRDNTSASRGLQGGSLKNKVGFW